MSNGVNEVRLIGNLGNEPEVKYTPGGMAVCSMSVATTSSRKKDGERIEETQWHRVKSFGKLGEICGEYLHKGSKVYIAGTIRYGSYEKDGVKHYTTDIIADEMRMLDGKREGGERAPRQERQAPRSAPAAGKPSGGFAADFADDDIPF